MLIRTLTLDDVSACLSLARQCDWPTDEARWRLLYGTRAPGRRERLYAIVAQAVG